MHKLHTQSSQDALKDEMQTSYDYLRTQGFNANVGAVVSDLQFVCFFPESLDELLKLLHFFRTIK